MGHDVLKTFAKEKGRETFAKEKGKQSVSWMRDMKDDGLGLYLTSSCKKALEY